MSDIKLESHTFVRELVESIQPLIADSAEKIKENKPTEILTERETDTTLSSYDFYNYQVFRRTTALLEATDRLKQIQIFINKFPQPRTYERHGISQDKWIEYHYSYYVITVSSLLDIALLLTNIIFRLGYPERLCNLDSICNNTWISKTQVRNDITNLEKLVKKHKELRNLHVHRGQNPDLADILDSPLYHILKGASLLQIKGTAVIERDLLDFAYREQAEKLYAKIGEEQEQLTIQILSLFDHLLPVYRNTAKALKPK